MRTNHYPANAPRQMGWCGSLTRSLLPSLLWAFALVLLLQAGSASGQITDAVSRFSFPLTSGGGKSSSGGYKVSGTIGQPGAGKSSSGGYTLKGGFQSIMGLCQSTGAPTLRIVHLNERGATIGWPASSTDWVLEMTTALASHPGEIHWEPVTVVPQRVDGEYRVSFDPAPGARYFRLRYH